MKIGKNYFEISGINFLIKAHPLDLLQIFIPFYFICRILFNIFTTFIFMI
jgi:hypothetical protein